MAHIFSLHPKLKDDMIHVAARRKKENEAIQSADIVKSQVRNRHVWSVGRASCNRHVTVGRARVSRGVGASRSYARWGWGQPQLRPVGLGQPQLRPVGLGPAAATPSGVGASRSYARWGWGQPQLRPGRFRSRCHGLAFAPRLPPGRPFSEVRTCGEPLP